MEELKLCPINEPHEAHTWFEPEYQTDPGEIPRLVDEIQTQCPGFNEREKLIMDDLFKEDPIGETKAAIKDMGRSTQRAGNSLSGYMKALQQVLEYEQANKEELAQAEVESRIRMSLKVEQGDRKPIARNRAERRAAEKRARRAH